MADSRALRLQLLVRAYCHLCVEMRAALVGALAGSNVTIDEIDVDADNALEARWGDSVPVLLLDDQMICRYHFDADSLARALRGKVEISDGVA